MGGWVGFEFERGEGRDKGGVTLSFTSPDFFLKFVLL
jgi:hypothetical protein